MTVDLHELLKKCRLSTYDVFSPLSVSKKSETSGTVTLQKFQSEAGSVASTTISNLCTSRENCMLVVPGTEIGTETTA